MPPEADLKMLKKSKMHEEMGDREASRLRAKLEASLAEGISWGMAEDAIEEAIEDVEEITWQTYKGQLTENQEKLRGKILKRMEKLANMKKEIDAIRAKDISQGGLTQGQQTQIARNEQRISQIMEELESLEETLNDSIQESVGARVVKSGHGSRKGPAEDEDDVLSDDDEFYDRAKKKPSIPKAGEQKEVETADSLLDKKEAITRDIEEKSILLRKEKTKIVPETSKMGSGDALDAYMTGLSSQLVLDSTGLLEKEISALQTELDRIQYLLKFADPTGEAKRRKESKVQMETPIQAHKQVPDTNKKLKEKQKGSLAEIVNGSSGMNKTEIVKEDRPIVDDKKINDGKKDDEKASTFTLSKPVWLGDTASVELKDNQPKVAPLNIEDSDGFVDYKDRKIILASGKGQPPSGLCSIEDAAPGLIVRKRKEPEITDSSEDKPPEAPSASSNAAETAVADAVALLLKHEKGFSGLDGNEGDANEENQSKASKSRSKKPKSSKQPKSRKVIGPERPAFLDTSSDYESWVPPKGQSGDGRTPLNERYGY